MYKPAIVIPTYNRPKSLYRLLRYIENAKYERSDITLIISIDGGGDSAVKELAKSFDWKHGWKKIILHEKNLGLREHILLCGDLSQEYGSIVMLEDDLVVSPFFYSYALQSINEYADDSNIAGVSLYLYGCNENASYFPFYPLDNGFDTFFMQVPSSWGQAWTDKQWRNFREFYFMHPVIPEDSLLPSNVLLWPESSWKKHFYNYMIECDLYCVYPYKSLSSNWGDIGTHFSSTESVFRVPLSICDKKYRFPKFSKRSVVYDAFFEILSDYLKECGFYSNYDFGVDLLGTKDLTKYSNRYFLSTKTCNNPITQYGGEMIPIEQNVVFGNLGKELSFAKRVDFDNENYNGFLEKIVSQYHKKAYYYGYSKGKHDGDINVRGTFSYKLGRLIMTPYRMLLNVFNRSRRIC